MSDRAHIDDRPVRPGPDDPRTAVALHYDRSGAPIVTAKGRGAIADAIIATAQEHGVAIEEDPILAEALSAVELGDEIPEELYRAVAAVIAYVLKQTGQRG